MIWPQFGNTEGTEPADCHVNRRLTHQLMVVPTLSKCQASMSQTAVSGLDREDCQLRTRTVQAAAPCIDASAFRCFRVNDGRTAFYASALCHDPLRKDTPWLTILAMCMRDCAGSCLRLLRR